MQICSGRYVVYLWPASAMRRRLSSRSDYHAYEAKQNKRMSYRLLKLYWKKKQWDCTYICKYECVFKRAVWYLVNNCCCFLLCKMAALVKPIMIVVSSYCRCSFFASLWKEFSFISPTQSKRYDRPLSRCRDILKLLFYRKERFTMKFVISQLVKLWCFVKIIHKLENIWFFKTKNFCREMYVTWQCY
jgi:hypothetical protein